MSSRLRKTLRRDDHQHQTSPAILVKVDQLHKELTAAGIPDSKYYLQGLYGTTDDNDKPSLIVIKGKHTMEYEVYYRERGEKHSSRIFTTEDDACQYFFDI